MQLVLIHGAYMGAWVWDAIAPELERLGHSVVAVDLPIGDSTAGGAAYARTVLDAVDWSVPTVLVAHSLGGLVAPLVAAERRVARIVIVAALLPAPGASVTAKLKELLPVAVLPSRLPERVTALPPIV